MADFKLKNDRYVNVLTAQGIKTGTLNAQTLNTQTLNTTGDLTITGGTLNVDVIESATTPNSNLTLDPQGTGSVALRNATNFTAIHDVSALTANRTITYSNTSGTLMFGETSLLTITWFCSAWVAGTVDATVRFSRYGNLVIAVFEDVASVSSAAGTAATISTGVQVPAQFRPIVDVSTLMQSEVSSVNSVVRVSITAVGSIDVFAGLNSETYPAANAVVQGWQFNAIVSWNLV